MKTPEFNRLLDPFAPQYIEWRVQQAGEKDGKVWAKVLAYVTNRAIMARLDEVCGPENWRNEYAAAPCGGIMCGISIYVEDRGWVTKWDGAENTDIEAVKGGLSGAMKRAAVQWGIGRFLYDLEEDFANVHERGRNRGKTKDSKPGANDGKWFKWDPPELPPWALPPVRKTTPPNAALSLRKLLMHADPETIAEVEVRIATGMTSEEARSLHEDLKARFAIGAK